MVIPGAVGMEDPQTVLVQEIDLRDRIFMIVRKIRWRMEKIISVTDDWENRNAKKC